MLWIQKFDSWAETQEIDGDGCPLDVCKVLGSIYLAVKSYSAICAGNLKWISTQKSNLRIVWSRVHNVVKISTRGVEPRSLESLGSWLALHKSWWLCGVLYVSQISCRWTRRKNTKEVQKKRREFNGRGSGWVVADFLVAIASESAVTTNSESLGWVGGSQGRRKNARR